MMRETKTLKGLFADPKPLRRKNFIKENVKSLRQMEKLFHDNNKTIKDLKLQSTKITKISNKRNSAEKNRSTDYVSQETKPEEDIENDMAKLLSRKLHLENQNIRKKSAPIFSNKKTPMKKMTRPSLHGNVLKKGHNFKEQMNHKTENVQRSKTHSIGNMVDNNIKENTNSENIKCKSQGVQTLDTNDIESLYSEGIIRYPSGKSKEIGKLKSDKEDTVLEFNESIEHNSESLFQNEHSAKTDKGSGSLASKLASQLNKSAPPSGYRVGVVPKYIKERKEALQKEKLAKIAAKKSDCPKGHVLLPDSERKETLSILKKNYQEYVQELNSLPIRTDTLRSQKRKMEIEKQLAKLEEAIKLFSRPKVFVKVDS